MFPVIIGVENSDFQETLFSKLCGTFLGQNLHNSEAKFDLKMAGCGLTIPLVKVHT